MLQSTLVDLSNDREHHARALIIILNSTYLNYEYMHTKTRRTYEIQH